MAGDIKAIVGDGILAEVLISSALKHLNANSENVYVFSKDINRRNEFSKKYGVKTFDNLKFIGNASVVILAVMPEEAATILAELKNVVSKDALIVSIVYALKISELESNFPGRPVVRVAGNPFMISGVGTCAYTTGSVHSADVDSIAQMILSPLGKIIKVDTEEELETVHDIILAETILTYYSVNAMIEGSIRAGLTLEKATEIVTQVLAGAITTITQGDASTKQLIESAKEQESTQTLLKHGKEIIDKYDMWGLAKDSGEQITQKQQVLKLHYHW